MALKFWKPREKEDCAGPTSGDSDGYDAPESDPAKDHLGRQQVAAIIYRLLVDTPQDWSTRVGLFGAWGEGKTTVCKFVEQRAQADGHLLLWFNPWSARTLDELWGNFSIALIERLSKAGIEIQGTALATFANKFKNLIEAAQSLSEVDSRAKAITKAGVFSLNMF